MDRFTHSPISGPPRRVRLWSAAALVGSTLLLVSIPGWAGPTGPSDDQARARPITIKGELYPARVEVGEESLALTGVALLRRFFFSVYVAGLYLPEGEAPAGVLDDVAKRLELRYFVSIRDDQFVYATDELLRRNLPTDAYARIRPQIEAMNALYRDVGDGDIYASTYLPGRGTELSMNGRVLGVVEGAEFAAAYFGMWLGPNPISEDMRDTLLRGQS